MQTKIKNLRLQLDGLAQLTEELRPSHGIAVDITKLPNKTTIKEWLELYQSTGIAIADSNIGNPITVLNENSHIKNCHHKLLYAKAWLGKCLGELGVPTPYKNDGNRKSVEDIEETADKVTQVVGFPKNHHLDERIEVKDRGKELTHIEKVDWLRQEIEIVVNEIKDINTQGQNREFAIARTNAYNYACEARFELGFELERLRNEK